MRLSGVLPFALKNDVHMVVNNKFLKALLYYNIILYCIIFSVYLIIDFKKHFDLHENAHDDVGTIAYYTLLCQTQVMAGEIVPKTHFGRALLGMHIFFSWFVIVLVMVPWVTT